DHQGEQQGGGQRGEDLARGVRAERDAPAGQGGPGGGAGGAGPGPGAGQGGGGGGGAGARGRVSGIVAGAAVTVVIVVLLGVVSWIRQRVGCRSAAGRRRRGWACGWSWPRCRCPGSRWRRWCPGRRGCGGGW